jgi:hypothetical protein
MLINADNTKKYKITLTGSVLKSSGTVPRLIGDNPGIMDVMAFPKYGFFACRIIHNKGKRKIITTTESKLCLCLHLLDTGSSLTQTRLAEKIAKNPVINEVYTGHNQSLL